MELLS